MDPNFILRDICKIDQVGKKGPREQITDVARKTLYYKSYFSSATFARSSGLRHGVNDHETFLDGQDLLLCDILNGGAHNRETDSQLFS